MSEDRESSVENGDREQEVEREEQTEEGAGQAEEREEDEGGSKPPPDDLTQDPAYEPDEPLRDIKGG